MANTAAWSAGVSVLTTGVVFSFSHGGKQRSRRLWELPDGEETGGPGAEQAVCGHRGALSCQLREN